MSENEKLRILTSQFQHDLETGGNDTDCNKQKIIEKLSTLVENLQNILTHLKNNIAKNSSVPDEDDIKFSGNQDLSNSNQQQVIERTEENDEHSEAKYIKIDPSLVQIKADKEEVDRRIQAFIEKKQNEVDAVNLREFCSVNTPDADVVGCARTDAVFIPRRDCKSHVKVTRVVNPYGPQTSIHVNKNKVKEEKITKQDENDGIEERLRNMEQHVLISAAPKSSLFERIKELENRILHLEGLSPEYFGTSIKQEVSKQSYSRNPKAQGYSSNFEDMNITDVDSQIQALKRSLLKGYLSS